LCAGGDHQFTSRARNVKGLTELVCRSTFKLYTASITSFSRDDQG